MNLEKKAGPLHYLIAGVTILALILVYNSVTGGNGTKTPAQQAGFDVTAMIVLGG